MGWALEEELDAEKCLGGTPELLHFISLSSATNISWHQLHVVLLAINLEVSIDGIFSDRVNHRLISPT